MDKRAGLIINLWLGFASDSYLSNTNKISSNTEMEMLSSVLYFFVQRDCRLLISTKCAGMGCDLPDIRLTVCIGKSSSLKIGMFLS